MSMHVLQILYLETTPMGVEMKELLKEEGESCDILLQNMPTSHTV